MNWEAIGAVAELLGAIGVILSLVYLALQIRQNTSQIQQNVRALELAALDASVRHGGEMRGVLLQEKDLSELWLRGSSDYEALDTHERMRFGMLAQNVFYAAQAIQLRVESGALKSEWFESQLPRVVRYLRQPGLAQWWGRNQGEFFSTFVSAVEEARREDAA
jgi:hypothetical protein